VSVAQLFGGGQKLFGGLLCLILVPGEFVYNSYVCTDDRGRQVSPG
jgi:hypothetical protein